MEQIKIKISADTKQSVEAIDEVSQAIERLTASVDKLKTTIGRSFFAEISKKSIDDYMNKIAVQINQERKS